MSERSKVRRILARHFSELVIVLAGLLAACSPQSGLMSKTQTGAAPQTSPTAQNSSENTTTNTPSDEQRSKEVQQNVKHYFELYPSVDQQYTPEEKAAVKKSDEAESSAEKNGFQNHLQDGEPEEMFQQPSAFEGLPHFDAPAPTDPNSSMSAAPAEPAPAPTEPVDASGSGSDGGSTTSLITPEVTPPKVDAPKAQAAPTASPTAPAPAPAPAQKPATKSPSVTPAPKPVAAATPAPAPSTPAPTPAASGSMSLPESPHTDTRDISPISALRNLLCEKMKPGTCLAALSEPIDQAIGYYYFNKSLGVGGHLIHATEMPQDGDGFHQKTDSRNAMWGTAHAVLFAEQVGKQNTKTKWADKIIIGDISAKTGGYLSPHVAHQSGLDVDIGFISVDGTKLITEHFPKDHVVKDVLTKNFDIAKNWALLTMMVKSNWTYLIVTHPAVKKAFCEYAKATDTMKEAEPILAQISPDKSHFDHFHVRLKCPTTSGLCIPGPVRSTSSGCK